MTDFALAQIGVVRSPYKEKFAVPRQPGLVTCAHGELHFKPPYHQPEAVRGLEAFSHIWLVFIFHQTMNEGWRPTVRPPRLGGNTRTGVFATRSTFRPNPLGMSLVRLERIEIRQGNAILHLGGIDLVDGTPVIDIKPYLPFAEALPHAQAGYAQNAPEARLAVTFTPDLEPRLSALERRYPYLKQFITEVLAQDPRPAYRRGEEPGRSYAVWLLDFNVRWRITHSHAEVYALEAR